MTSAPRAVVLVEGVSDRRALETLAARRGRVLAADGVAVVAMGGAKNIGRFLERYGPRGIRRRRSGLVRRGRGTRRPSRPRTGGVRIRLVASASWRGSGSTRALKTSRTSSSARSAPTGEWTSWRSGVSSDRSGPSRSNPSGADGPSTSNSGASSGTRAARSSTRPCWSGLSISRGLRDRWTRCSLTSEPRGCSP